MRPSLLLLGLALLLSPSAAPLAEDAPSSQGWLGVMLDDGAAPVAADDGAPAPAGVRVRGVVADGPAEQAHVRSQDRILAVDGRAVGTSAELMARLRGMAPGTQVRLSLDRAGRTFEARARLGERPAEVERVRMRRGWIGVNAIDLPPSLRVHFGAPESAGVMVSAVQAGSPAEAAGLRVGDVIVEVGGRPVRSMGTLTGLVAECGVDNPVEILVQRDGTELVVEPVVAAAPDRVERAAPPEAFDADADEEDED